MSRRSCGRLLCPSIDFDEARDIDSETGQWKSNADQSRLWRALYQTRTHNLFVKSHRTLRLHRFFNPVICFAPVQKM